MTSESKTWRNLRTEYLRQVEKALSSVRHPGARAVLEDVGGHLDRRLEELPPEQRNAETLRAIIADMGPPADYAVLLDSGDAGGPPHDRKRSLAWAAGVGIVLVVAIALIAHVLLGRGAGPNEAATDEAANIAQLIADLSDPEAPPFVAQNKLIRIGGPAVPMLIEEMETSYNWQIPKALGAIGDERAVEPLIEKLEKSDSSPMRGVVVEALGRITDQDFGSSARQWRTWWGGARTDESAKIVQLIADLSDPEAPRFTALQKLIEVGGPAVPMLIGEMEASNEWQIPKVLGAIGDRRAVGPLIEKLGKCDLSPMREVVVEALGRITDQDFGSSAEKWRTWWKQAGQSEGGDSPSASATAQAPDSVPVYIVTFRPSGSFHPQTSRALLEAFNENHPRGVRTHHYRTEVKDEALIGYICVDTEAGRNAVEAMLKQSDKLELVQSVPATPEMLEGLYSRKQVSLPTAERTAAPSAVPVYIVTFRPVEPFAPRTSRALLDAFNANHPRGVRTHHYRTQIKDNALVGFICVDSEAGKDAVETMLKASEKLELIEAIRATPEMLEELYGKRQVSLPSRGGSSSRSRKPSRRVSEPMTYNRTVTKAGTWPPGDCFISAHVSRRAMPSQVDHGKVCLSSDEFGSWVVEMESNGSVSFRSIPPGTYRLYTTDTLGYRDAYYNPLKQTSERPAFELKAGDRINARIQIEPLRPYRKLTGHVVSADGGALEGAEDLSVLAWVQRSQGVRKGHYRVISRSRVQTDGSYSLGGLDGRPVYVQVCDGRPPIHDDPFPPRFHPGVFSREKAEMVTFGDAAVVAQIDVVMERKGGLVLEGLVTDEKAGAVVPRALISVCHHDMLNDRYYTYTNEHGRYRLEGLGAGILIVHVDAVYQGYVKTRMMAPLASDAPPERLDLTLRRGANISGALVDQKGRPYPVGRGQGNASCRPGGFAASASNFPYGNRHAPEHIRTGSTVFYQEGEGDAMGTIMVFPSETTFLLPSVAPGDVLIRFSPRGPGERVTRILHQGRDILKSGLTVTPEQDVTDVTIVVERPESS